MIRAVVIGASGYAGIELATLLTAHPEVEVAGLFGSPGRTGAPVPFAEVAPRLRGVVELALEAYGVEAVAEREIDVALLATPHEASAAIAPALLERGVRVIDLSGAFRLADPALYPPHYAFEHPCPGLLADAVYGLPEIGREGLAGADLVAVAGCYPSSALIPLAALRGAGCLAEGEPVIVNSVSGVSGAGRRASAKTSFCEVSLAAYAVLSHRHEQEMAQHSGLRVRFTPHVAPFDRGLLSTIHVELAPGWDELSVRETLEAALGAEPFVRLLPAGSWPSVGAVARTNFIDIGVACRDRHAVVVGAIDNLVKGAAGQAVQCLNAACGLEETLGLRSAEGVPA